MADREELEREEDAAYARLESEDAYAQVYAIGGVIYCGMCDQPLTDCTCFPEEDRG